MLPPHLCHPLSHLYHFLLHYPRIDFPYKYTYHDIESVHTEGLIGQIQLKGLNLQAEGARQMTRLQTISASWVICDSWAGVAGTIALAISQGGPVTLVYGPILMLFLVGACALTLAELASVYPTAGGQYHWTSILAPRSINRSLVCLPNLDFCCFQELTRQSLELLLRNDKCVFLDCHLHRDRHHSRTADCGNRLVLQSELYSAAVALFPHLSSYKRMCFTI